MSFHKKIAKACVNLRDSGTVRVRVSTFHTENSHYVITSIAEFFVVDHGRFRSGLLKSGQLRAAIVNALDLDDEFRVETVAR